MKFLTLVIVTASLSFAVPVESKVKQVELDLTSVTDAATGKTYLTLSLSKPSVLSNQRVDNASLEFKAVLTPGQRVELWATTPSSSTPWVEDAKYKALRKGLWLVNENSEDSVRFDVTAVVQELLANKTVPMFVIRAADEEQEKSENLALIEGANGSLILHLSRSQ